jgi:hypothetical protein
MALLIGRQINAQTIPLYATFILDCTSASLDADLVTVNKVPTEPNDFAAGNHWNVRMACILLILSIIRLKSSMECLYEAPKDPSKPGSPLFMPENFFDLIY